MFGGTLDWIEAFHQQIMMLGAYISGFHFNGSMIAMIITLDQVWQSIKISSGWDLLSRRQVAINSTLGCPNETFGCGCPSGIVIGPVVLDAQRFQIGLEGLIKKFRAPITIKVLGGCSGSLNNLPKRGSCLFPR